MDVIVIGGGVSGLMASLALGRDGHSVTVIERDPTTSVVPVDPNVAFIDWERKGAVHVRQSHAFLARIRNLLRDRAPDVLAELLHAGATEITIDEVMPPTMTDRTPRAGDEDMVMLACRRITFEWVLRRIVAQEPHVTWLAGQGVGAPHVSPESSARIPMVDGVTLDDGTFIGADLVVDASGRRSPIMRWMAEIGADTPPESVHDCGIVYYSRFYRFLDGQGPPPPAPASGDLGYLKFGMFRGDNRTFSLTMASYGDDRDMRCLSRNAPFELCAQTLAPTASWVEPSRAEPITDVQVMAKLRNRSRHFVVDGKPLVLGLAVIGDAAMCTNPLYGRGCSLGSVHAFALTDALRKHVVGKHTVGEHTVGEHMVGAHTIDHDALALDLHDRATTEIEPFYKAAVRQDRDAEIGRAIAMGTHTIAADDPAEQMRSMIREGLMPAVRTDPVVFRAFFRGLNLLAVPDSLMSDADVIGRVVEVWNHRDERAPEPPLGPPRDEMIKLLAAV